MLHARGCIDLPRNAAFWYREQLRQGIFELPVTGGIGIRAVNLEDLPGDPADRLIVATALEGYRLLTADLRILE